jgi:hypothetical protein
MVLAGCAGLRPTEVPMPASWYPADSNAAAETLLVMLPGARDSAADFERAGVVDLAREVFPAWDLVAVDAHFGYYRERSFVDRLAQDIIGPARERGYRRIWLTGPSLGGFGSLLYLCNAELDGLAGVIAVAPHLGGRAILGDIESAGGPAEWRPGSAGQDFERELWQCLRDGPPRPVWLAWGESDRMDRGNRLLAELLPDQRVVIRPGGHRWSDWIGLWAELFKLIEEQES